MTGNQHAQTDPAAFPAGQVTETEFRALYDRLRRQVPWGPDDRRGALNYITPAEVLAALGEPTLGRTVSLAAPVEHWPTADNPDPAQHQMKGPLGADAGPGLAFSMDRIAMNIHGNADSHVDALCHVIFDGTLYNGVAAAEAVTAAGAAELSIGLAADGIVGRGVLLDVPRSRRVPWLEPGDHVTAEDLHAAERDQGVRVGRGAAGTPAASPRSGRSPSRIHAPPRPQTSQVWNGDQFRRSSRPGSGCGSGLLPFQSWSLKSPRFVPCDDAIHDGRLRGWTCSGITGIPMAVGGRCPRAGTCPARRRRVQLACACAARRRRKAAPSRRR
jgi:Putative cyclase